MTRAAAAAPAATVFVVDDDADLREALASCCGKLCMPRHVCERPRVQMLPLELPLLVSRDCDGLKTTFAYAKELSRATGKRRGGRSSVGVPLCSRATAQCS